MAMSIAFMARQLGDSGEVGGEVLSIGAVDAHRPQRRGLRVGEHAADELARRVLLAGCDGVLEVGDDGVRVRLERAPQLALVGARREEERADAVELAGDGTAGYMSDIQVLSNHGGGVRIAKPLDTGANVRHKHRTSLPARAKTEVSAT